MSPEPRAPKALIGLVGPDFTFPVELGKVREFARALHAGDLVEGATPIIPPTFLFSAGPAWGYTLERPGTTALALAGMAGAMTLHGEYAVAFPSGPPRVGATLSANTRIADVVEKQGRRGGRLTFYVMETAFRDAGGTVIAIERTTSVMPENAPSGSSEGIAPLVERPPFRADGGADLMRSIEPADARTIAVGDGPGPLRFPPLSLTEIVRYQGASLDLQPMHHDDAHARRGGYPGAFSVGMLHVGTVATYATAWLGVANLRSLRARFLALQWPGDELTYDGTITRIEGGGAARSATMTAGCARQSGERTLDVALTFAL